MKDTRPRPIHISDYQPPPFTISKVELKFDLFDDEAEVTSVAEYKRTHKGKVDLVLSGRDLTLVGVKIDGSELTPNQYVVTDSSLTIKSPPEKFRLEIVTKTLPHKNKSLEGLFMSGGKFCTQCEPEGFRKITYFLDRPDVLAKYTTTVIADKKKFPVLLSNGNLIKTGDREGGRHFAEWHDPFPKASYLFALVAGDLAYVEDFFTTKSGRRVTLRVYVEHWNVRKCDFAMQAIKDSMRWDEELYGREYDLDMFLVVAISDFNMGAMENKGLNIFNDKYVLANPETATDEDFEAIQGIIAHEYFHNWTGNRVTLRDWFQLSLKEGLTVFRDQEFSSDMVSRPVIRIKDVQRLRVSQFLQDSGPMAHAVRPQSYIEISNFYTTTVYEKGAEVVRMVATILGPKNFRKGMDLYFKRHDGQAITTDDFIDALSHHGPDIDWDQFKHWYDQAGTPLVKASGDYDKAKKRFTLKLEQNIPDTPGQKNKKPHIIPIKTALLGHKGNLLAPENVLLLDKKKQSFTFDKITEAPVPSLLRDFSAPVRLEYNYSKEELLGLMRHDSNDFNRYEAHSRIAVDIIREIQKFLKRSKPNRSLEIDSEYFDAFRQLLRDPKIEPRFLSLLITVPGFGYLTNLGDKIDTDGLYASWKALRGEIAKNLYDDLLAVYSAHSKPDLANPMSRQAVSNRALKNACLSYLMETGSEEALKLAAKQFDAAQTMTDSLEALGHLASSDSDLREQYLEKFYGRWKDDHLVVNKWFNIQTDSEHPKVLQHFKALLKHEKFDVYNPNKVYALFFSFFLNNPRGFHHPSGMAYRLYADYVLKIDKFNASVAARLASTLIQYKRFDSKRAALMKAQLQRIYKAKGLSKDVFEIVSKALVSK
ncbi:MAG: aminopeptidase N [Oligoflexales bacterium]